MHMSARPFLALVYNQVPFVLLAALQNARKRLHTCFHLSRKPGLCWKPLHLHNMWLDLWLLLAVNDVIGISGAAIKVNYMRNGTHNLVYRE